ncbi:prepilin-type N-terminal cleavage/methylation domain-containing protein [Radiobacillus kanasensis]|uniref:prepilin-type N-terminal cleavage/methylation domain-containing protein n=1 Tax=Radiobacillus kanasensis TaxID=2844358 RepID=UPI001E5A709D|nr:prepilin-type N-terminal cleavage/methylation domain-containing protein [Radiobacillus kanasensis]UFT97929.1 prepilin-type N-terminal cleavage/methylation domain-containing protein [Radiobacillus kanasensis]
MLQTLKKLWKRERGFTLVELLAVIAILAIITAIAIPGISTIITKAKGDVTESQEELFEEAARLADANGLAVEDVNNGNNKGYEIDTLITNDYIENDEDLAGNWDGAYVLVENGEYTFNAKGTDADDDSDDDNDGD